MMSEAELEFGIYGVANAINELRPRSLFIAAESKRWRDMLLGLLRRDLRRAIIEPIVEVKNGYNVPRALRDWFALTLCSDILLAAPFSTFSGMAAIRANSTLWSIFSNEDPNKRGGLDETRYLYKHRRIAINIRAHYNHWNANSGIQAKSRYTFIGAGNETGL